MPTIKEIADSNNERINEDGDKRKMEVPLIKKYRSSDMTTSIFRGTTISATLKYRLLVKVKFFL
ncbi:MAG: hypothetical protein ACP5FQ_06475 [Thermoplasmata archaeon]